MNRCLYPRSYAQRTLTVATRFLLEPAERVLAPNLDQPLRYPPIFLLGAPRSGSTLATQVITDALDLGYISNRHCQWFGAPAFAERLFHPTAQRPSSDYRSTHGQTNGPYAPAECGKWWYRFFRRKPSYVRLDEVDPRRMARFRRSVAALTESFDRPVLFKNLYASLRIQAIAHYLPESLFVVIHRNEVDNGHSLLESRYRVFGGYEGWWSMEPPEIEVLKRLPAHAQVIEQVRNTYALIENDLAASGVPAFRRFDLYYEDFCVDPPSAINALDEFLTMNSCSVARRGNVPTSFQRRNAVRIDKALYEAMSDYARR